MKKILVGALRTSRVPARKERGTMSKNGRRLIVATMAVAVSQLMLMPVSKSEEGKRQLPEAVQDHTTKRPDGRTTTRYSLDAARLKKLREAKTPDEHNRKFIDHHVEKSMREGRVVAA